MKYLFGPNNQFSIEYDINDFEEFYIPDSESRPYDLEKVDALVQKLIEKNGWKPEFVALDEAAKLRERTYYDDMKESFDELEENLIDGEMIWLCSNYDYCQDFTEDNARSWIDHYQDEIFKANKRCDIKEIVKNTFTLELLAIAYHKWP